MFIIKFRPRRGNVKQMKRIDDETQQKAVQDTNSNMLTLTLLGNMLTIVHDRVKAYNIFIHIIFFTILNCWPHDGVCWFINRQCLENVVVD